MSKRSKAYTHVYLFKWRNVGQAYGEDTVVLQQRRSGHVSNVY